MKTLAETLFNYYKEHEDDFSHDIEELDSWNDIRVEKMDKLDEFYQDEEAAEILNDIWHEENCEIVDCESNPNRDYFYDRLYLGCIQNIIRNECHLDLSDGAREIIDNYDEDGDSNEN